MPQWLRLVVSLAVAVPLASIIAKLAEWEEQRRFDRRNRHGPT